jgi:hypothetical protein
LRQVEGVDDGIVMHLIEIVVSTRQSVPNYYEDGDARGRNDFTSHVLHPIE